MRLLREMMTDVQAAGEPQGSPGAHRSSGMGLFASGGSRFSPGAAVAVLQALVIAIAFWTACCVHPQAAQADEGEGQGPVRVLFVGNSFTYNLGMGVPGMLESVAAAQGRDVDTRRVTYGGAGLADYAFEKAGVQAYREKLDEALADGVWDYVVLQESSKLGVNDPMVKMHSSVRALKELVEARQPDAEVLLYMTHGFDDGTKTKHNGVSQVLDASDMQLLVQAAYVRLGERLGLRVVPVGMYFQRHAVNYPYDSLLKPADKHPNASGYFLAGCAFYEAIFGERPLLPAAGLATVGVVEQMRLISDLGGSISMSPASLSLAAGESAPVSFETGDSFLVYGSVDPDIAKVGTDKQVTALACGLTAAYVQSDTGLRAVCAVSVEDPRLRQAKLAFAEDSVTVAIGKAFDSALSVSDTLGDYGLSWSSSDEGVAAVDELGRVTALKAGRSKITVRDSVSGISASYLVNVRLAKPLDVTVARAASVGAAGLRLRWSGVADATGYSVYRSNGSGGDFKRVGKCATGTYFDAKAPVDAVSRYYVVATMKYAACSSANSAKASGVMLSSPAVSTQVAAKSVKVSWNRNGTADGYLVYRAQGKAGSFSLVRRVGDCDITRWTDKSVKKGKVYRYRVRSFRECNDQLFYSAYSKAKSAKVPKPKPAKAKAKGLKAARAK